MALKSLKNDLNDIIKFGQEQETLPNSCINMFIISDLLDAMNGKKVLEIQSNKTGTTQDVLIQDVCIDTNPKKNFVTYELFLNNTFDGNKVLVINVSKVDRHDTNLYKHYLYDIVSPNNIAYRLQVK